MVASIFLAMTLVTTMFVNTAFSSPLVAGPGVSQIELEEFARASSRFPLSQHQLATRVDEKLRAKLRVALEKAQAAYLGQMIPVARSRFKEITELKHLADWDQPQREAIHYAFFRLAQTSDTSTERDEWLTEAARTFPDLAPDAELFPPPLIEEYHLAGERIRVSSQRIDLASRFPGYRFISIDGKKHSLAEQSSLEITAGTHRISAYSDSRPAFSETMTTAQLASFQTEFSDVAMGTCSEPQSNPEAMKKAGFEKVEVLFPGGCVKEIGRTIASNSKTLDLRPTSASDPIFNGLSEAPMMKAKRDWLLIGLITVAAGAAYVIYRDSQKNQGTEQVHRTGF